LTILLIAKNMFKSVLVVCVGNICRSPVGERLLQRQLPGLKVASAGIGALVGHPADSTMSEVAAAHGLSLEGHIAQQFTAKIGHSFDLVLAMEPGHKRDILRIAPQLTGRTMLFDQWVGAKGIADPYRHKRDVHERVFQEISVAADSWATRLQ
jgi:protein-tyrosine phosphatase